MGFDIGCLIFGIWWQLFFQDITAILSASIFGYSNLYPKTDEVSLYHGHQTQICLRIFDYIFWNPCFLNINFIFLEQQKIMTTQMIIQRVMDVPRWIVSFIRTHQNRRRPKKVNSHKIDKKKTFHKFVIFTWPVFVL